MVRAKFRVDSKTQHTGESSSVKLFPVYGGSKENEQFFKSTPTGSIELTTLNPAAAAQFEVGKEYYIDFTLAEKAA